LVGVVLLGMAGGIGQFAWRRRALAAAAIAALGLVGVGMALLRPGSTPMDTVPSIAAAVAGAGTLLLLTRLHRTEPGRTSATSAERGRDRRRLMLGLGGAGALALVGGGGGELLARSRTGGAGATTRALPRPGSPAAAIPAGAQLPGNTPFITDIADFYRVDISLITPKIGVQDWTLTIDGMVDRPLTLTYDELLELPMIERTITMTCVSNEVGGGYVSTARWLGVPFSEIAERVGIQPGADQAYSYSLDSGYTCSTPLAALTDGRDAMIAIGMNGETLPDKNGFPARMLVPGLFGFVSATKWLRRIEFTTYAERSAYWTDREWATDAPVLTQSRIDVPKSLATLPRDRAVLAGVAWAQHRGIAQVQLRIDGGDWQDASLATDAGIDLWRQWSFVYDGPPGQHTAEVRATDATGEVQPEQRTKVFPDGARGWHQIVFTTE
jgi:DMSO/TMAO reductase YedYZ molybdopterin-dependent catalytic subunit